MMPDVTKKSNLLLEIISISTNNNVIIKLKKCFENNINV